MTNSTPDEEYTEETGLNLFDDRASAAGSFPHAMLGYDRPTVDNYVRDLEQQVATLKQLTRHLRSELASAQSEHGDTDFTRLGAHATSLLRAAEAQAGDLIARAAAEAERIKEEGRRLASDLRANAQTEADDIRVETLANLRTMREKLDEETSRIREATQNDCRATLDAARTQAFAIVEESRHNTSLADELAASKVRQQAEEASRAAEQVKATARDEAGQLLDDARAEAEQVRIAATAEGARIRSQAHDEAQLLLASANSEAAAVAEKVAALLADATTQHENSLAEIAKAGAEAGRIRSEAIEAAEQLRAQAAQEAEAQVAASHRQAAMMKDRVEEQFAWRKEQLEREVSVLMQRKDAIIAQMGNLKRLADEAAADFPNADPFAEPDAATSDRPDASPKIPSNEQWLASLQAPTTAGGADEPTTVLQDNRSVPAAPAPADAEPTAVIASDPPTKIIARVEDD